MVLKMYKSCPKHFELILEINKSLFLHLVGLPILFTYSDDARSNTNQRNQRVKHLLDTTSIEFCARYVYDILIIIDTTKINSHTINAYINDIHNNLNPICKSQLAELFCGVFKFCA